MFHSGHIFLFFQTVAGGDKAAWPTLGEVKKTSSGSQPESKKASTSTSKANSETSSVNGDQAATPTPAATGVGPAGDSANDSKENKADNGKNSKNSKKKRGAFNVQ